MSLPQRGLVLAALRIESVHNQEIFRRVSGTKIMTVTLKTVVTEFLPDRRSYGLLGPREDRLRAILRGAHLTCVI